MFDNILFEYEYRGLEFGVIAQPIVDNSSKKIHAFELLSRSLSVECIERFFGNLSVADVTDISCVQMEQVSKLVSSRGVNKDFTIHVNIHYRTLFNVRFIKLAKSISEFKFAFEIDGFVYDSSLSRKLKKAFHLIQSLGHEVWLDDYGVNNATMGLLLELPWDGVKIDKGVVWRSSQEQLCTLVHSCKFCANKVTLEGVEDEYLNALSIHSGADFSQGFNWGLLDKLFFIRPSELQSTLPLHVR